MFPLELIVIVGVVGGALLEGCFVYKAIKNTRRARWLAAVPLFEISKLQEGPAKVQGRVLGLSGTIVSPLAARDCVYYHFEVREKRHRGGMHGAHAYWKTVVNDTRFLPCVVDDGTAGVALRLGAAEIVLQLDSEERTGFFHSLRAELAAMLKDRYGVATTGWIFNRTFRFRETRIEEGDMLTALGTARPAVEGGWELTPRDVLLIVSDKSPEELLSSYRWAAIGWWLLAVVLPGAVAIPLIMRL